MEKASPMHARRHRRPALAGLLFVTASAVFAQEPRAFTGVISDSMCERGDHAGMRMGPTDGECATACVLAHGATYVLVDGTAVYALSDQSTPESFAGQRVRVVGRLDTTTRTIHVQSIDRAR